MRGSSKGSVSPAARQQGAARLQLVAAMVIFGTIGLFRRSIPLPSGVIAMLRGAGGTAFLLLLNRARGRRLDGAGVRRNLPVLVCSGAVMGFNWILLFEAYNYTTVATATLCYYMAPIFVMLASPLLGERLTGRKIACVLAAPAGMVLVSGVTEAGFSAAQEMKGVALGLGAAALYAGVILLNKRIDGLAAGDRTIVQLGAAALVLLPYALAAGELAGETFLTLTAGGALMLLIVCVVHTGAAYALYFGSIKELPAQTAALLSYIDPVVAVLLSALLLGETMSAGAWAGALLVLGAAIVSELPEKHRASV